jgi:hypothetical protein
MVLGVGIDWVTLEGLAAAMAAPEDAMTSARVASTIDGDQLWAM